LQLVDRIVGLVGELKVLEDQVVAKKQEIEELVGSGAAPPKTRKKPGPKPKKGRKSKTAAKVLKKSNGNGKKTRRGTRRSKDEREFDVLAAVIAASKDNGITKTKLISVYGKSEKGAALKAIKRMTREKKLYTKTVTVVGSDGRKGQFERYFSNVSKRKSVSNGAAAHA
jgi:hypothetical protein